MSRNYKDWIAAYLEYSDGSEASPKMRCWSAVSVIAGALRRQVWIDQAYFKWYPNFYLIFVAPPGIVSKSTTTGVAMRLLRKVPGVHFGPDSITSQDLVRALEDVSYLTDLGDLNFLESSALTLHSSELGTLLDPKDSKMVELLITLWDGLDAYKKSTKTQGKNDVPAPWVNICACTTPAWMAKNFAEYTFSGGLTSRMLFVYEDRKHRLVPYPDTVGSIKGSLQDQEALLAEDLKKIAEMAGEYKLTTSARLWGERWYEQHYGTPCPLDPMRFGGYWARKQTHIHKLAMVLAASQSSELYIEQEHLEVAAAMVTSLEKDMPAVFTTIGTSWLSAAASEVISVVHRSGHSGVTKKALYRAVHHCLPREYDFEDVLTGCLKSGRIALECVGDEARYKAP